MRTAELVGHLGSASPIGRAAAADLQSALTWRDAIAAITSIPGVGPYFGGQALCGLYLCFVQQDDTPDTPFRTRLMPRLEPASLRTFASPGPGPIRAMERIFGRATGGSDEDKMAWLAGHAAELFEWAELDFPWEADASAPGGARPLSAVDVEHSLCYFSRLEKARESLGTAAKPLHDAFVAVSEGKYGRLKVQAKRLAEWKPEKVREVLADMSVRLGGKALGDGASLEALAAEVAAAAKRWRAEGKGDPAAQVADGTGGIEVAALGAAPAAGVAAAAAGAAQPPAATTTVVTPKKEEQQRVGSRVGAKRRKTTC